MLDDISAITIIRETGKYLGLLASIIGTLYFYKYKHTYLKYVLYLLWYVTFSEFFAEYAHDNKLTSFLFFNQENGRSYTYWIYNLLDTISFLTYYYIFYHSIITKRYKLLIKIFAISYIILSIINWAFIQNFFIELQSFLFIIGAVFLIISIIFYFIEFLKSEKVLLFHKSLLFWMSVGLLLYYAGNIPFAAKFNGYALIPGIHQLFLIVSLLSITMYICFIIGFIWSKKE